MADVTLPGDIAGLLRPGSPVVPVTERMPGPQRPLYGVVIVACGRRLRTESAAIWVAAEADTNGPRWGLVGSARSVVFGVAWQRKHEYNVPALSDLDPDDPRTLPDGSRLVDAEALRLVVLHIAGRTP